VRVVERIDRVLMPMRTSRRFPIDRRLPHAFVIEGIAAAIFEVVKGLCPICLNGSSAGPRPS